MVNVMELIKGLLKSCRDLIELCEKARNVDKDVFAHVERATKEIAAALITLRTRGKLDPETEKELESILGAVG